MSSTPFVTYNNFDVTNLKAGDRQEKQIPAKPGQQPGKYNEIPLFYQFDVSGHTLMSDLRFEFPELYSNGGIVEKVGQSGRPEWSIAARLPQTGETLACKNAIDTLHKGAAQFLNQIKGAVGMYEFNVNSPTATGFKSPVVLARDKMTGEIKQGFDPMFYFKMMKRYDEKTLFTDLRGKPLDWELLKGVEMKFIPLVHFKTIYVGGGKGSLQHIMVSAVVTSIVKKGTETTQTDTIARITSERPDSITSLEEQIRKLMDMKNEMIAQSVSIPVSAPTPQIPSPQQSPRANNIPSMNDFLAKAPTLPGTAQPTINLRLS
jgi:hypothetical protein